MTTAFDCLIIIGNLPLYLAAVITCGLLASILHAHARQDATKGGERNTA
jgi:hypothetical protein